MLIEFTRVLIGLTIAQFHVPVADFLRKQDRALGAAFRERGVPIPGPLPKKAAHNLFFTLRRWDCALQSCTHLDDPSLRICRSGSAPTCKFRQLRFTFAIGPDGSGGGPLEEQQMACRACALATVTATAQQQPRRSTPEAVHCRGDLRATASSGRPPAGISGARMGANSPIFRPEPTAGRNRSTTSIPPAARAPN